MTLSEHKGVEADPAAQPAGPLLRLIKDRRIAFLAVGGVNTAIGFSLFVVFNAIFGSQRYLLTLLCAHIISVIIAFVLYRYLVFKVRGHLLRDAWRFESVYLIALAANAALLHIGVSWLHQNPVLVQAVVLVITTTWSYIGHGRFSFARTGSRTD